MQNLLVFIALLVIAYNCDAKRFSRCELVRELRRQGFANNQLRDWVCLIESESGRNTHVVSKANSFGFRSYGLFQISDALWCNNGSTPGKICNVKCSDLLTDDISKASSCAKIIYNRHRFQQWDGWRIRCQGSLPNISSC